MVVGDHIAVEMSAIDDSEVKYGLHTVSRTEETCLIIGTYIFGPMAAGIAICLMVALIRFISQNPKNLHLMQCWFGFFRLLFTILLSISYCILGTDLIVPWNDDYAVSTVDDYDSSTMLEFTSLCIFLWYFGKLFFYIAFIYYAHSLLLLSSQLKLYLRCFILIQVILTLLAVGALVYLNHNLYQIAVTPMHQIQIITQLKGPQFVYRNTGHSITEIASMIPLLTDISCLMVLFRVYIFRSQQVLTVFCSFFMFKIH